MELICNRHEELRAELCELRKELRLIRRWLLYLTLIFAATGGAEFVPELVQVAVADDGGDG